MGPLQQISAEDQKTIEALLSGEIPMPETEKSSGGVISIGTKVHPIGYRESLYGIVSAFKRGQIQVSFTHLKESGNKPTKKWFKVHQICRFEDRHEIYAKIEKTVTPNA